MTNEKMEQRLAAALEKTAPDDAHGVLSRCEERKGTVINMATKKQQREDGHRSSPPALRWRCSAAVACSTSERTRWRPWYRWM